jgi:ABC-type uncharacterized transport system auxiliary subunit
MRDPRCTLVCFALALAVGSGCALLSKADSGSARYFRLEREDGDPGVGPAAAPVRVEPAPALRIGRVTGSQYLDEQLVYRASPMEVGYSRDLRWTEPPEVSMGRILAHELFEDRYLRHVVGGPGPSLDVHLAVLDEIRGPRRVARARILASLHDGRDVLWEATVTVDRQIEGSADGDLANATVEALGEAMQAAVEQVADHVVQALEGRTNEGKVSLHLPGGAK